MSVLNLLVLCWVVGSSPWVSSRTSGIAGVAMADSQPPQTRKSPPCPQACRCSRNTGFGYSVDCSSLDLNQVPSSVDELTTFLFLDELCDISMVEGSAARIDGRLGGFPDPTVTWYKDGQEIKEGPKYNIIFEEPDICALVIRNTEADDVGTYTCKAFNNFGEAFDSAKVNINVPAKIEKGPPNQSCKNGSCITLKATISGNPEPMVGWAKDGEDIDEDDRIFYDIDNDTTVLTIKNCTKKDAGKYEVYVENDLGFDHSFSRIEVK